MNDLMGLIYTGENDSRLRELTLTRAVAALPVVGRYRVIDFHVSNLVNSGARNVGIITQRNYHSLMDHLGSGKEWDLHGKHDGLFILPPFLTSDNVSVYEGMLDGLRSNLSYLRRSRQEYVLVTNSHVIYNVDYRLLLDRHLSTEADITLFSRVKQPCLPGEEAYRVYFDIDKSGVIDRFEINPSQTTCPYESLSALIIKRDLLVTLVSQAASQGRHSFVRDVLQRAVNDHNLRVMPYLFEGRAWHLDSVQAYYQFNMDVLDGPVRRELFVPERPIYTKVRDDMAARYGDNAQVSDSLIADGGRIDGTVEHSILFRGVTIAPGAVVRNSIIMQDARIMEGAELDHCILDKQSVVRKGVRLIGPANYPILVKKNVVM